MIFYAMKGKLLILFFPFLFVCMHKNCTAKNEDFLNSSGKIEYDFIDHYQGNHSSNSQQWNELIYYHKLKFDGTEKFYFFAEGMLRENFNYKERTHYMLKEAYTTMFIKSLDLKIGKQIISWGVADEIKLVDYFKRYDYTDLLRKEIEGIMAVRTTYYLQRSNFDFVWAPGFDSHRLSFDPQNPWSGIPNQGISLTINNDQKPARNIASSQFGFRFEHQAEGLDISLTYIYGIDRLPTSIKTNIIGFVKNELIMEIIPIYRRTHLFGVDWNKSFLTWNLKGEFAYILTDDPKVDPCIKGVLGMERYFSRLWNDIEVFTFLQLAFDRFYGEGNQSEILNEIDYNHYFDYAITLSLDIKFSESYILTIKGISDIKNNGGIFQSEFNWKPRNSVVVFMGFDYLKGKEKTYFGSFRDNDRIFMGMGINF